ncbi:MAG: hypothetical protein KDN20_18650 [Verrucomicrobiae bacterium]|nr:hypothetical protein [Verrucomicrobiae bacterium]
MMKILFYLTVCVGALWAAKGSVSGSEGELSVSYDPSSMKLEFSNHSDNEIRILRPLDGSEWCWIYPYYKFEVTDSAGNKLPLELRCGNFGYPYSETNWPDDYLIVIPAGKAKTIMVRCPMRFREGETYSISMSYIFTEDAEPTPGYPYPKDLWIGTVKSKPATYTKPESD